MVEAFSHGAYTLLQAPLLSPLAEPLGLTSVPGTWGSPDTSLWNKRDLPFPEFS